MVLIYTHTTTARLQYICTFIFKQLLNVNFAITIDSEEFKNYDGVCINYSNNPIKKEAYEEIVLILSAIPLSNIGL